jgi:hypothetical protein
MAAYAKDMQTFNGGTPSKVFGKELSSTRNSSSSEFKSKEKDKGALQFLSANSVSKPPN